MIQFFKEQILQVASKVTQVTQQESIKVNMGNVQESVFQTAIYKKYLKQKLIQKLNLFGGKKVLVVDSIVGDMLITVVEQMSVLKEQGIDQIYLIDREELDVDCNQIIFFVRPERIYMKNIVHIIRNHQMEKINNKYLLIFCPNSNILCKDYLDKQSVLGDLTITNFNFDLIPLNNDLLSLEFSNCLKQLYIYQDMQILQTVGESIQRMEIIHGRFKNIYAKGNYAKYVVDILKQKQYQGEIFEDEYSFKKTKLHSLFIVDRKIDFITPLLTPFTYEALIDEFFNIKQGQIDLEIIKNEQFLKERKKMKLNDQCFSQIKNMNIRLCQLTLEDKKTNNSERMRILRNQQKISGDEMKEIRQTMNEQNLILDHIVISHFISNEINTILFNMKIAQEVNALLKTTPQKIEQMIDNLISLGAPITQVLRLFSLYNQVQNTISSKKYDYFRREILHMYGVENVWRIENCEKVGLLGKKLHEYNVWERIEQPLRLINEQIDHEMPEDLSFVYLAYAPIIARMFEEILTKGNWNSILDAIKQIPGEMTIQQNLNQLKSEDTTDEAQIYVIYVIGGITYGEIAAIRWLGLRYKKDIQICTTHIINGNRLFQDMLQ